MRLSALASVLVASAVIVGCTTRPIEPDRTRAPGRITVRAGIPGTVVAAPHGTTDQWTAEMAAEIAGHTGFGLVVATGFDGETDARERTGRRYQVNRPLEGVPGGPSAEEIDTPDARAVYESYERRVREASQGPLRFYVEIHGNSRRESADRIEIATVGVDAEASVKLRTLFELVRDAHLRARAPESRLDVRVEPADVVYYTATGAKRVGILRLPQRALHIELPRAARQDARPLYTQILSDFLREAAALPLPARR
jgi:hypothetical protein